MMQVQFAERTTTVGNDSRIVNALTIDVEDYYHVSAFEKCVRRSEWDNYESRVVASTRRILRLLERAEVRATFFVLGWVADHHPQLVHEIAEAGHEIACHGYWHQLVYHQSPSEFRRDIRRARDVLEQIVARPVVAYRAPSFSITRASTWALDVLIEEGFTLDSSIYPTHHDRYGIPGTAAGAASDRSTGGQHRRISAAGLEGRQLSPAGRRRRVFSPVPVFPHPARPARHQRGRPPGVGVPAPLGTGPGSAAVVTWLGAVVPPLRQSATY